MPGRPEIGQCLRPVSCPVVNPSPAGEKIRVLRKHEQGLADKADDLSGFMPVQLVQITAGDFENDIFQVSFSSRHVCQGFFQVRKALGNVVLPVIFQAKTVE